MGEFHPTPFPVLVNRFLREITEKKAAFGLPRWKFFQGDRSANLGVTLHGHWAATPFGPAAGPHSQLAQNILTAWLAGARIIELKTVQVNDRITVAKPSIDSATVGYNIEWSQELTLEQSLEEYVKAAMLIELAKAQGVVPDAATATIFDISVGYDLDGIRSPKVQAFLAGMLDASETIARLSAELAAHFPALPLPAFPSRISDSVTLSTFHGCPPEEIEAIATHLMTDAGFNVVVKLNPTLLGRAEVDRLLHDRLGYREIEVPDEAFASDPDWYRMTGIVGRLAQTATRLKRGFGVKFTNTLLVRNHLATFPAAREMYLSGAPLHVLAIRLVERFRAEFGDRLPISFSAGIDAENFADVVALGLKPVSVCTDLLKTGGYGRAPNYLVNLIQRMTECEAPDLDVFTLKAFGLADATLTALNLSPSRTTCCRMALETGGDLRVAAGADFAAWVSATRLANTRVYAAAVADDPRYSRTVTLDPPRKSGVALKLLDCETCGKCVGVCPNFAIFRFAFPRSSIEAEAVVPGPEGLTLATGARLDIVKAQQIGIQPDSCNSCGNCDVVCPESGGPHARKPGFYISLKSFEADAPHDGLTIEALPEGRRIHGRIDGARVTIDRFEDGSIRYRGAGFDVELGAFGGVSGTAETTVDLLPLRLLLRLADAVTVPGAVNMITAALSLPEAV